jgi:hypothetical protein
MMSEHFCHRASWPHCVVKQQLEACCVAWIGHKCCELIRLISATGDLIGKANRADCTEHALKEVFTPTLLVIIVIIRKRIRDKRTDV